MPTNELLFLLFAALLCVTCIVAVWSCIKLYLATGEALVFIMGMTMTIVGIVMFALVAYNLNLIYVYGIY